MSLLMIVNNLNFPGIAITPGETDVPLRVDANTMLPKPIAAENFQPIAERNPQVIDTAIRVIWPEPVAASLCAIRERHSR